MKIQSIFLLFLLLPCLVFAQDSSNCKKNDEVIPDWVCNAKTLEGGVVQGVGVGKSYRQAMTFALCDIGQAYSTKILKDKKNTPTKGSRQYTKLHFGKNIDVITLFRQFRSEENADVNYYRCRIGFKVEEKDLFVDERIIETVKDNVMRITYDSKYVIPSGVKLSKSLVDNGVEIVNTFISQNYNFYVLIGFNKLKIKNIH